MRLSDGVELYVAQRRSTGIEYTKGAEKLLAFSRLMGDIDLAQVRTHNVVTYLDSPKTGAITRQAKYQMLERFFKFWSIRGDMPELLMPPAKAKIRQTFVPYVFSRAELRSLLKATIQNDSPIRRMDRQTLRTFILVLYATGTFVGELLNLTCGDVDLDAGVVSIINKRRSRARRIPIGKDLRDVLQRYLDWRRKKEFQNALLFVTKDDFPITNAMITLNWQRLRRFAGVSRTDGGTFQPRLQDLRCTFAVHRITSWIRNGADLNRMLPALAAYLGQVGMGSSEVYLALTPERFRKELDKLSPIRGKGRWRDNKVLMDYIAGL
jgi:integrase/recombinase XerD